MTRRFKPRFCGLCAAVALAGMGGCATSMHRPDERIGALPVPGVLTLYTTADPQHLGRHVSGLCDCGAEHPGLLDIGVEVGRGIVYTRKAGFIDIAHVRNTIDWTYYFYRRLRPALAAQRAAMKIDGCDRSVWRLRFDYSQPWQRGLAEAGQPFIDQAALRLAQQIAYDMMTWHEIITAFGYASTGILPETRSAFTYEDITSHALGIEIAGEAIRARGCFDQAVTRVLQRRLDELQAVSPELTDAAIELVRERWWTPEHCLRYQYDVGLASRSVTPWLVAAMSYDGADLGRPLLLASLGDVMGVDLSTLCHVAIEPHVMEADPIRRALGGDVDRIVPAQHFARIIECVRQRTQSLYGPDSDKP